MQTRQKIDDHAYGRLPGVNDLERTPHYPYLDKVVTDEDVEKLCEVVEKMFDK